MTTIDEVRSELLTVAAQSGPYTEFDLQQNDFVDRAVRDFISALAVALEKTESKPL